MQLFVYVFGKEILYIDYEKAVKKPGKDEQPPYDNASTTALITEREEQASREAAFAKSQAEFEARLKHIQEHKGETKHSWTRPFGFSG
jgi:hypothetical protein